MCALHTPLLPAPYLERLNRPGLALMLEIAQLLLCRLDLEPHQDMIVSASKRVYS